MSKITRRMYLVRKKINQTKKYKISEALLLLKETATAKFVESIDVAINLGIDPRKPDQNVQGTTMLPHGTGRLVRVAVFSDGLNAEYAKKAGAEQVGMEDLAEKIKNRKINFDVVIASPDAMHIVSSLGQVLGPRVLMPNPKVGTVTSNIAEAVKNFKAGQIRYRSDKNAIIHTKIGNISFEDNKIKDNLEALLISIKKEKPSQVKGVYIKKVSLSTTMGIGIELESDSLFSILN